METMIKENELPVRELEKLGLYQNGALALDDNDIAALLSGRRTDMRSLKDLEMDGFQIKQLDAKLSLSRDDDGKVSLKLHPIYREVQPHPLLSPEEIRELQAGKLQTVQKVIEEAGKKQKLLIEYDEQTKEFVSYDPEKVQAPETVNGETLSEKQKKAFRNGELVTLSDGTRFQHSATDSKGIRADRKALILSVLLDGGISYLVFRGIKNLFGKSEEEQKGYSKGYTQAMTEMMGAKRKAERDPTVADYTPVQQPLSQESRSYERTRSR